MIGLDGGYNDVYCCSEENPGAQLEYFGAGVNSGQAHGLSKNGELER